MNPPHHALNRCRLITAAALLTILPVTASYAAEEHVVPLTELHQRAVAAAQQRQQNLSDLDHFFSGQAAGVALHSARLNGEQVRQAVATLSDDDLARLAGKAREAQSDFAAGALSNQEITYILIALGTAVLVLVLVK